MQTKGVTLIESVVVIAILVIATLIVSATFVSLYNIAQINLAAFEVKSQAGVALQRMTENIEEASLVLSSFTIHSHLYTTSENTLVLKLPSVSSEGEIIPGNFDYAAIFVSAPSNLIMDTEPSASSARPDGEIILSNLAENLNFRYNSSTSTDITTVEIFLKTAKSSQNSTKTSTLSTTAHLENK